MRIGILAFTERGKTLANSLGENLKGDFHVDILRETTFAKQYIKDNFKYFDGFVFISAVGIAVRMIAPYVESKDKDPGVVVVDEKGEFIIPILSGHLGGANELARTIEEFTKGKAIITTATDINNRFAVDNWSKKHNCHIEDISKIKVISSEILRGNKVSIKSEFDIAGKLPEELTLDQGEKGIYVGIRAEEPFEQTLWIVPRIVTLGIGCKKNTDPELLRAFIEKILKENNISIKSVEKIASIDLKKEEKAILSFGKENNIPLTFFTKEQLLAVKGTFTSSDFVKKVTGVDNVCERSAKLGSDMGKIIMGKTCHDGMTIAIGVRDWNCIF